MAITLQLDDYGLPDFMRLAAGFGCEGYAYVVTPNVDHIIRYSEDASFRELYAAAGFVLLDSRFLARLLRATKGVHLQTCPGSDVTARLFEDVIAPDDKVVLIGGSAEDAQHLALKYGMRTLRHFNPPMGFIHDPAAMEACLRFVENESPFRFCLLAVGCPQQETVARALQTRGLARGLALCVGASINFLTGSERRAPRWMQDHGIEWLSRLLQNPGRLAKRYLLRGPRIFLLLPRMRFERRPPIPHHPRQ
jgi:N-acetylglucosaminyldiphosphoundecaprenol N-acetyl-beta-D-mannosaminyltransferase